MSERQIVIVDMDGTLADVAHRLHHIKGPGKKNWKAFFRGMDIDPPNPGVVEWVRALAPEFEIVIATGRPEEYRRNTETWLKKHGIEYSKLLMRSDGDHRSDTIVKKELLDHIPRERVAFVIDDRPTVCDMWRGCGLKVYQIPTGEEF